MGRGRRWGSRARLSAGLGVVRRPLRSVCGRSTGYLRQRRSVAGSRAGYLGHTSRKTGRDAGERALKQHVTAEHDREAEQAASENVTCRIRLITNQERGDEDGGERRGEAVAAADKKQADEGRAR